VLQCGYDRFTISVLLLLTAVVRPLPADTYDERTLVRIAVPQKEDRDFILSSRIDVTGAGPGWVRALLRQGEFRLLEDHGLIRRSFTRRWKRTADCGERPTPRRNSWRPPSINTASKFDTANPASNTLMKHLLDLYTAHPTFAASIASGPRKTATTTSSPSR